MIPISGSIFGIERDEHAGRGRQRGAERERERDDAVGR